jgi:IS30 family transposase
VKSPATAAVSSTGHWSSDGAAWALACRPEPSKLAGCVRLRAVVEEKLEVRWSPEQVAGWLARQFPDQAEMQVWHETIYRSLFVQSRGALRKELTRHLRTKRAMRRPAGRRLPDDGCRTGWRSAARVDDQRPAG